MNVAIFTDNDFGKVNGVTTTLTAALDHAPPGMHLRIYTAAVLPVDAPDYLALKSFGVPIPFYGEMDMFVPRLRAYVAQARTEQMDVIHLTTPGPIGLAGMYAAWRLRLPMVGSFHTDLAAYTAVLSGSPRLGALMREYMRWPYGKCARVLVPSEDTRRLLIGAKGHADRIEVWPRGVDTSLFSPDRRSRHLRDTWHVSENRPAILYVGRISREKGLHLLAPIQRRLHALGIEHRFIIAGDGPLLGELRRQMPDAIFTGVLPRQAIADAFASSDVFVFPSRTDTAGNVVLEAQASGVPVVVADEGGPRENMVDGSTGTVCSGDAPDRWSGAIARVLQPGVREPMAATAREYALTRQWAQALQPLYRAYRDVCPVTAPAAGDGMLRVSAGHRL